MSSRGTSGNFLDEMLAKRTRKELTDREEAFREEHAGDTDDELLEYLRLCALELGHTPNSCEIIGGSCIQERFGTWSRAVRFAGLPRPGTPPKPENRKIYRDEYEKQRRLFLREKRERKKEKEIENQLRRQKAEEDGRLRQLREEAFAEAHGDYTDEQLLDYLRDFAARLGRTPYRKEVPGGDTIQKRFGSWPVALILAGLELPRDMKPPKPKELNAARKKLLER